MRCAHTGCDVTTRAMPRKITDKIVDLPSLVEIAAQARLQQKTVVQCHGCFDIVHPGHVRYLEFARQQGDLLIVSLTGDANIDKGDMRPYIPQELRAENLAALMFVDYVLITDTPTAHVVLEQVKPDIYVKGREYEHANDAGFLSEKGVVEGYGGRIIFSSGEVVFSSTALMEQSAVSEEFEAQRLCLMCNRYGLSRDTLQASLTRFRDLHVVVVGDTVIDRYILCDAMGIAHESPMISLSQRDERMFVGGAAIVARHVAALGAHTFLLTAGGDDNYSRDVANQLKTEGIHTNMMKTRPSLVEKTRFLVDEDKLFKVDKAQSLPLDSVAERRAALILEQQSRVADAIIFCDFGYGMITGGLLSRVLPTIRQNVNILSADVSGGRANLLNFRHVDLLCPTERELRSALNDYDSGLSTVAWQLLQNTQARHLIVTLEKRGMVIFERQSQDRADEAWSGRLKSEHLPSFATRTVDRLGCGDAALAAGTLSLAAGNSLMQAAYIGNATAALEIAQLGNHPISAAQMGKWIRSRGELVSTITRKDLPREAVPTIG